ncbi:unnamed protein product [Malus baccata var. baccata]
MESEASELPKSLVLYRGGYLHIRHITPYTSTTSRAQLCHSTILSALGPDHTLTILNALARTRLTSEFRWNPKPGGNHVHIRHIIPSPLVDVGYYNPPSLGARHPRRHTRIERHSGSDTKLSHPGLASTVARYCPIWAQPRPHGFVSGNSHENFPVGHPSWDCSHMISLNFRVTMESETSELPKCLVLYGGGHVHIKHITPSPLVDVRCYTDKQTMSMIVFNQN